MAWAVPPTWTPGQTIPSSNLNVLRDDLLATAPGVATTAGRHIVTTGANSVAERVIASAIVAAGETTNNTSYVSLATAGPTVASITTGTLALVIVEAQCNNTTTSGASVRMSFDVSGATTSAAVDERSMLMQNTSGYDSRGSTTNLITLTAGVNTFTPKYRVSSGTGRWQDREEIVIAL